MKTFSREEFSSRRRADQDTAINHLLPAVTAALDHYGEENWWRPLLAPTRTLFNAILHSDSGGDVRTDVRAWARLAKKISDSLPETGEPGPNTARTLAIWLSTAAINSAAIAAAAHDTEPLVLQWVTMHDDKVRHVHEVTDGQERPPGEPYDVAGVAMFYPGDPSAPIAWWINCRCMLRPALANATASLTLDGEALGGTMTDTTTAPDAPADVPAMSMEPLSWHGVLAPEGVWSGDGRMFADDSLRFRDLPLPLTWQKASQGGHDGSVVVAKIEAIARVDGQMRASGHFLSTTEADEAVGLLVEFGKFGVSVDADDAEFEFDESTEKMTFTSARIASASMVAIPAFSEAFITLGGAPDKFMPMPPSDGMDAECDPDSPDYQDCMDAKKAAPPAAAGVESFGRGPGWFTDPVATKRIHDYWTVPGQPGYEKVGWGVAGDFNRCKAEIGQEIAEKDPETVAKYMNQICAQWHHDATGFWPGQAPTEKAAAIPDGDPAPALTLVASVGTVAPALWFKQPLLSQLTPVTVTDEGRIFGHLAGWKTCHAAYPQTCVSPPHSASGYAQFLTGEVMTDEGPIPAGRISLGSGHANGSLRPRAALAHYDNTATVVARVTCGEDEHGIWLAGQVMPGIPPETVDLLRLSPLSGDWRTFGNDYDLIAALAVNAPGFPIPRVGITNARQTSLVAAGVVERANFSALNPDDIVKAVVAEIDARAARKSRLATLAAKVTGG